jgi:tetratricopeptide (TPR) repeat protein
MNLCLATLRCRPKSRSLVDLSVFRYKRSIYTVLSAVLITSASGVLLAADPPAVAIQPLDNLDKIIPDLNQKNQFRTPDDAQRTALKDAKKSKSPVHIKDDDIQKNPRIAEIILNQAIPKKDWKTVAKVLPLYKQAPHHDALLVAYAEGALLRHQGKYRQAIENYQSMLKSDPSLDHVRFDLAAMYFENRQYRDAEAIFRQSVQNPNTDPNLKLIANKFLQQIQQRENVHGKASVRMLYSDNINQATNDRYLYIGAWRLKKSDQNMPRSSAGSLYTTTFNQDINLLGNHYLSWDAGINALSYASGHEFDEQSLNFGVNYKWQDAKSWLYVGQSADLRFLDKERYMDSLAMNAGYGRWLTPRWQATLSSRWMDKQYKDHAYASFDGSTLLFSPSLVYVFSANSAVFAGGAWQKDHLEKKSESFDQYAVNVGLLKQWRNGFNLSANLQLAWRLYADKHPTYSTITRKDRRLNAAVTIAHKALKFYGIEPKLIYQYDDVDSNIDVFYSRKISQVMLSLERKF